MYGIIALEIVPDHDHQRDLKITASHCVTIISCSFLMLNSHKMNVVSVVAVSLSMQRINTHAWNDYFMSFPIPTTDSN